MRAVGPDGWELDLDQSLGQPAVSFSEHDVELTWDPGDAPEGRYPITVTVTSDSDGTVPIDVTVEVIRSGRQPLPGLC